MNSTPGPMLVLRLSAAKLLNTLRESNRAIVEDIMESLMRRIWTGVSDSNMKAAEGGDLSGIPQLRRRQTSCGVAKRRSPN
ncbi:hypothetical protein E2C01_078657 [Portunus trituberculatus]|uniref:Uncharacterized protein n=1 Tax=Portunus trituberculatus TaxID=210409 RepID=A0A5B7IUP9_PORTR|nr:hypothetical protein [Portunus trituberculatus]